MAAANPFPTGKATLAPGDMKKIIVPIPAPLAPGTYRVAWHAVSTDNPSRLGTVYVQGRALMLEAGLVGSRFIHFLAVLSLFGTALFPLYTFRQGVLRISPANPALWVKCGGFCHFRFCWLC